jgi:UDP-glucose 4-epimerase
MKILITGKNSFIGNAFAKWINEFEPTFQIYKISLKNQDLKQLSFKDYDVVFHIAGVAHISSKKILIDNYFKINRDLAIDVANKAKEEGVKQFIFTSSMAIYGDDLQIGEIKSIDQTKPNPTNAYGQSKLEADLAIQKLNSSTFRTIVLRVPMVYGDNSKGNFHKLLTFSKLFSIFPRIENCRSVLHVNNLTRLLVHLIKEKSYGTMYPQDNQYLNTIDFIRVVRRKKIIIFVNLFNSLIVVMSKRLKFINKIFGNKFYNQDISKIKGINYQIEDVYGYVK